MKGTLPICYISIFLFIVWAGEGSVGAVQSSDALWFGRVTATRLFIRSEPSTSGEVVGAVEKEDTIAIVQETANNEIIDRIPGTWYLIKSSDGTKGYVFGGYVERIVPKQPVKKDSKHIIIGLWRCPAGKYPEMDIIFEKDNSLVFQEGFEFLNPARWSIDEKESELLIVVPNMPDDGFSTAEAHINKGGLARVDRHKKTIYYRIDEIISVFFFQGFNFIKQ